MKFVSGSWTNVFWCWSSEFFWKNIWRRAKLWHLRQRPFSSDSFTSMHLNTRRYTHILGPSDSFTSMHLDTHTHISDSRFSNSKIVMLFRRLFYHAEPPTFGVDQSLKDPLEWRVRVVPSFNFTIHWSIYLSSQSDKISWSMTHTNTLFLIWSLSYSR